MRALTAGWLVLVAATACAGKSANNDGGSDGTENGCPTGYPYCATLDACLLPGRVCPPMGSGGTGSGGTGSGGTGSGGTGSGGTGSGQAGAGLGGTMTEPPVIVESQESTPNQIRCGNALCDAVSEYCCTGGGVGPTGSGGGNGRFEICSKTFCGFRRECDETADCVGSEVCCYSVVSSPPPLLAATCQQPEQCAFDGYWLGCGSQEDCTAAGAPDCMPQACGGQVVQTCGPITRSACKG